jgi:hypothetical protein
MGERGADSRGIEAAPGEAQVSQGPEEGEVSGL